MDKRKSNRELYPEAWNFFEEQARNIMEEPDLIHKGNYRIPKPDRSGNFIYADSPEILWSKFIESWYKVDINSESVYGKIQYIVQNF
jgi:hypothetical protein